MKVIRNRSFPMYRIYVTLRIYHLVMKLRKKLTLSFHPGILCLSWLVCICCQLLREECQVFNCNCELACFSFQLHLFFLMYFQALLGAFISKIVVSWWNHSFIICVIFWYCPLFWCLLCHYSFLVIVFAWVYHFL